MELALYILSRTAIFQGGLYICKGSLLSHWDHVQLLILICPTGGSLSCTTFFIFSPFSISMCPVLSLPPHAPSDFRLHPSPGRSDELIIPNQPSACASSWETRGPRRCLGAYFYPVFVRWLTWFISPSKGPLSGTSRRMLWYWLRVRQPGSHWRNSWMKLDNFH